VLGLCQVARPAEFAGGTGEPNNPYQIATGEQLIGIGSDPNLLDKHFVLVSDIDLDPNLPGGRAFEQVVIGTETVAFSGSFDGRGRTIANLHIVTESVNPWSPPGPYLGLFRTISPEGSVCNLNLRQVRVTGGGHVGALAVENQGSLICCSVQGVVKGMSYVGGLVATNSGFVACCHADVEVTGIDWPGTPRSSRVGGLIGQHRKGLVTHCSARGRLCGDREIGGLIGYCAGQVTACHAAVDITTNNAELTPLPPDIRALNDGLVSGGGVGGLVGNCRSGTLRDCYAAASITAGPSSYSIGGLAGESWASTTHCYAVTRIVVGGGSRSVGGFVGDSYSKDFQACFFLDPNDGGGPINGVGTPLTDAQMRRQASFLGWDFVGETANGTADIWWIDEGKDYPRLWWERYSGGSGTADDPYRIATAAGLIALGERPEDYDKHFVLIADIDLDPNLPSGRVFDRALIAPDVNDLQYKFQGTAFTGIFDGEGHAIRNLTIADPNHDYLGLFGMIAAGGQVCNLALEDAEIAGGRRSIDVGTLAGCNAGTLAACSATGIAIGCGNVRELAGSNTGTITECHADVRVSWLCE
jgi:hypothetical protein